MTLCDETRRVPGFIYEAGQVGATEFLRGFAASRICVRGNAPGLSVVLRAGGLSLARDLQHLLSRIGIASVVDQELEEDYMCERPHYVLIGGHGDNIRRFAEAVSLGGEMGKRLRTALQAGETLPLPPFCGDLLWERVRSVEAVGEKPTYDIRVPETGNFLAEGAVVHNSGSIEAEADLVSFIYRPAYYERKQEIRAGDDSQGGSGSGENSGGGGFNGEPEGEEAEVIIAKHRNGPTGTVKVSFLARFARFDNLANRDDNPF